MSFPAYFDTTESGFDGLGEVPKHWTVTKVRRIAASVETGGTPSAKSPSIDEDDGFLWFTPGDFKDDSIDLVESSRKVANELIESGEAKQYPPKSVLIVSIGATLGKVGYCTRACSSNQQINAVIPNDRIQGRFLAYSLAVKGDVMRYLSNASTIGIMNQEKTKEIALAVPPLDEQKTISSFLDVETTKIDGLVSEQRRLIRLLAEKRQAVISHAVTKGLDPNVPMKPSGIQWLGDVPQHWRIGKCGYYVSLLSGFAFPSSGFSKDESNIKLLRGINVGVSEIRWNETVYWQRQDGDELDRFQLSAGDLVIGMDRPWISSGVRVAKIGKSDLPCLLLQRVAAISTDERLHTDFLWHLLSSEMFIGYFEPETTGVSVPHISPSQIEDFTIPVPPIEEQNEIVEHVATEITQMDTLLAETERAIELLQERRTALISAAVTGKIDVRHCATKEAA